MPDLRRSPTKVNFTHHNFTIWNDMLGEMMPVEVHTLKMFQSFTWSVQMSKDPWTRNTILYFNTFWTHLNYNSYSSAVSNPTNYLTNYIWFQNMKSKTCARSEVWRISKNVQKYCLCVWNWAEWTDKGKEGTWLHTWRQNVDLPASDKKHQNGIKISIACFQIVSLCSLKDIHSTKQ